MRELLYILLYECYHSRSFLYGTFFQEILQLGAASIASNIPVLSTDDLADQVAEVLNFFG